MQAESTRAPTVPPWSFPDQAQLAACAEKKALVAEGRLRSARNETSCSDEHRFMLIGMYSCIPENPVRASADISRAAEETDTCSVVRDSRCQRPAPATASGSAPSADHPSTPPGPMSNANADQP